MIPFLDVAGYQYTGFRQIPNGNIGFTFTLPSNAAPPDLSKAEANGVRGIISRACNAVDIDPTYRLTVEGCRTAGIVPGIYAYLRPTYSTAAAAAEACVAAAAAVGGVPVVMADCEAMLLGPAASVRVEAEWKGRPYADWLHQWLQTVEAGTGRRPIIYTGRWWWDRVLADCGAEFAGYDFVLANYPHQPRSMPQPLWPAVPFQGSEWYEWATTTQGGDPGSSGPTLVSGVPSWAGWQFSSWGKAADYGFSSGGRLDLNVAKPDAWERWTTKQIPTSLTMPRDVGPGDTDWYLVQLIQSLVSGHLAAAGLPVSTPPDAGRPPRTRGRRRRSCGSRASRACRSPASSTPSPGRSCGGFADRA